MSATLIEILAPTGKLRVGLYPGSPGSLLQGDSPESHRGVGFELGRALAEQLGIVFEPVIFKTNGEILHQAKLEQLDVVFVNATAVRAEYLAFAQPLLFTEQTYLIGPSSNVRTMAQVDTAEMKVGVSAGSTSEATLPTLLRHARIVTTQSLEDVVTLLSAGALDAFATNKSILSEIADRIPGSRILDGAWGRESIALGIPKRREQALSVVTEFCDQIKKNGLLSNAVRRSGMRGAQL